MSLLPHDMPKSGTDRLPKGTSDAGWLHSGTTFIEIISAMVFLAIFLGGIFGFLREINVGTGQASAYLRAFELAQEAMTWVGTTPLDAERRKALKGMAGSVHEPQPGRGAAVAIGNHKSFPVTPGEISYPEAYDPYYFYRTIDIEPVPGKNGLFEITVTVSWNEGTPPSVIEPVSGSQPERMKKIVLSTLAAEEPPHQ
ncbi:MAG: hypothetical protein WA705_09905 [Candidatus Ozemobacteraceae bacterium]